MASESKISVYSEQRVGMASESKVTLKSSDNELFEVSEPVAFESLYVKNMIEVLPNVNVIPLLNVSGEILSKVVEYLKYHVEAKKSALTDDEIKTWDKEFVKVDLPTLFDYIEAANYLNIKILLDLTCETLANMMRGETPQEIRETFNIKNDFTPEEEDVRPENQSGFE